MSTKTMATTRADVTAAVEAVLASWGEVQNLMTRLPGIVEGRFGIPPHRLHVLGAIERGASRIQDIADASWTSVSAASRTVDGLVKDGWLDRRPDPEDRRATRVTLTDTGTAQLARVRDWAQGMVARMVETLGTERADRMAEDLAAFAAQVNRYLDEGEES